MVLVSSVLFHFPNLLTFGREGAGNIFAELSNPPQWVFTCYKSDASPQSLDSTKANDLRGDYSPEEVRWNTYQAFYKGNQQLDEMVGRWIFKN